MKKLKVCLLLFIIPFLKVSAASSFSEWSMERPNLDNIVLETEQRYLYYRESEQDIEYMKYADFLVSGKEQIDLNVYNYSDIEKIDSPLPESMHYDQSEKKINARVVEDDTQHIKIGNYKDESGNIRIRDISFTDKSTMQNIPYTVYLESETTHNSDEIMLKNQGYITLKLDKTYKAKDILVTFVILRDEDDTATKTVYLNYYNKHVFQSYSYLKGYVYDYNLLIPVSLDIDTENINLQTNYIYKDKIQYYVTYKLYKTFNYGKEIIGYFTSLEGDYLKEEEPVTFYRYKLIENEEDNGTETNSGNTSNTEENPNTEEIPGNNEETNDNEENPEIEEGTNEEETTPGEETNPGTENPTGNDETNPGTETDPSSTDNNYSEDPEVPTEEDPGETITPGEETNTNTPNETPKDTNSENKNTNKHNYEYLYEYPINHEDKIKDYNIYEEDEVKEEVKEECSSNKELIAMNTQKEEDPKTPFFKIFFFVSYICLLILLIILLINRLLKKSSYVERV